MPILRDIRQDAIGRLTQSGIEQSVRDVDLLLEDCLGVSALDILVAPDRNISAAAATDFDRLIARRLRREPVSQILGYREFWSLRFKVSKDCLTPRPDSETLIETALAALSDRQMAFDVVDFGTGSGCLLLSLLSELPNARGTAVDLSNKALMVAQENATTLGFADRCDFILSDWDAALPGERKFDVILCNPPYIALSEAADLDADVREYEPHLALFAEDEGLKEYKRLARIIPQRLNAGGMAVLEIGHLQGVAVRDIFSRTGAQNVRILQDLAGRDRCVSFIVG